MGAQVILIPPVSAVVSCVPMPTELQELRAQAITLSGGECEWPYCSQRGEQLAHLEHRGMGGSRTRNRIDNVAWVCVRHHDVLDGRTGLGILRVELNETLRRSMRHGRAWSQ